MREQDYNDENEWVEGSGNVFLDAGFSAEEAAVMAAKSKAMIEIEKAVRGMNQVRAAEMLGIPRSRLTKLRAGVYKGVTLDKMFIMAARVGTSLTVSEKRVPKRKKATAA